MSSHITGSEMRVKVIHKRITNKFFLIIGQSNANGQGVIDAGLDVPKVGVYMVDLDYNIIKGEDPIPSHADEVVNTMGFGMSLARDYIDANPSETVTLALSAKSGTGLGGFGGWQAGGAPYLASVKIANKLINMGNTLGGIFWLQGISDTHYLISGLYADNLTSLASRLRDDITGDNARIPFVVGTMPDGYVSGSSANYPTVNRQEVQDALIDSPNQIPNCALANLTGLAMKDIYHYSASSLRTAGSRFYTAFATL